MNGSNNRPSFSLKFKRIKLYSRLKENVWRTTSNIYFIHLVNNIQFSHMYHWLSWCTLNFKAEHKSHSYSSFQISITAKNNWKQSHQPMRTQHQYKWLMQTSAKTQTTKLWLTNLIISIEKVKTTRSYKHDAGLTSSMSLPVVLTSYSANTWQTYFPPPMLCMSPKWLLLL